MRYNFKDLTGKQFSHLTVISLIETATRNNKLSGSKWLCQCNCGTKCTAVTHDLTSGRKKFCGAICGINYKPHNKLEKGLASFNALYKKHVVAAKLRKLNWDLNKEQFKKLVDGKCSYCGIEPLQVIKTKGTNGYYKYNGIDRIDSRFGYVFDNVVSCCKTCNRAKNDLFVDEFMIWIDRLVKFHSK